uniref:RHS repeat-associated core domain-containing protein n=1 Tax=Dokdonella sp. TaxID=2291710 RepID=UPI00378478BF
ETNSIGNSLARYHYSATQLISRTEQGSTPTQRHYLLDSLATPIALLTQQGSVSARTKYDAWGEIVTQQASSGTVTTNQTDGTTADLTRTDAQPIGYTGYLTDPESGLYYAKARYYDPRIARFTTEDPEEGHSMQPPSLHRYLYAYANPTVYTDPTGRCSDLLCAWALGMSHVQDDSDRTAVTLAAANTSPALGRAAGAAYEIGTTVTAPAVLVTDAGAALSGDAAARTRMGQRYDAAARFSERMQQAQGQYGEGGPAIQLFTDFATGVGEHAAQAEIAGERYDYFEQGRAGTRLAGDAATVATVAGGARSLFTRTTTGLADAGAVTIAERSTGETAAANIERGIADDLESGFSSGGHTSAVPDPASIRPVDSPNYSVAFKVKLEEQVHYPGRSDEFHFQEGNRQLDLAMNADLALATFFEKEYPGIAAGIKPGPRGAYPRRAPISGLTWHHASEPGSLELVPTNHHEASGPVQQSLHPERRGGMEEWGGGRKRRKAND